MHSNDEQIRGEKLLAQAFEYFAHKWAPRDNNMRQEFRIALNEIILQTFRVAQDPPFRHLALVTAQLAHPLQIIPNVPRDNPTEWVVPKTQAITLHEGGEWIKFATNSSINHVNAIRFDNGFEWNCTNGWRAGKGG